MDYKDAPEVREIAQELIEEHHSRLANTRIAFAFTDKAGKKNGKTVLGKASIESGKSVWFAAGAPAQYVGGKFFLIAIPHLEWTLLDEDQRRALVDHELCHLGRDPETGEPMLLPHDIEEFGEVVQRHGLWLDDIRRFVEAANAANQPDLPFDTPEPLRLVSGDASTMGRRIATLRAYHDRYLDDPGIDPADEAIERLGRETAERIEALESGAGYVPADDCALLGRWRVVYPDMASQAASEMVARMAAERMPGASYSVEDGVPTITVPGD